MIELSQQQSAAVGGGLGLMGWLSIAGLVVDIAQGFNDAYNAANVQK